MEIQIHFLFCLWQTLFPGLWLMDITVDSYKVPESADNGKVIYCLVAEKMWEIVRNSKVFVFVSVSVRFLDSDYWVCLFFQLQR